MGRKTHVYHVVVKNFLIAGERSNEREVDDHDVRFVERVFGQSGRAIQVPFLPNPDHPCPSAPVRLSPDTGASRFKFRSDQMGGPACHALSAKRAWRC